MTIGNQGVFCFLLCLTDIHLRDELNHVGDVSQEKIKYRPMTIREIGSVTLSDVLYEE